MMRNTVARQQARHFRFKRRRDSIRRAPAHSTKLKLGDMEMNATARRCSL
jgi:hypothetical protein